jgi:hypothetical protein
MYMLQAHSGCAQVLPLQGGARKVQLPVQAETREFRPRREQPGALAAGAAGADADLDRTACELGYGWLVYVGVWLGREIVVVFDECLRILSECVYTPAFVFFVTRATELLKSPPGWLQFERCLRVCIVGDNNSNVASHPVHALHRCHSGSYSRTV